MHSLLARPIAVGFLALALSAGLNSMVEAQTLDPQSLLGEWQGSWSGSNAPGRGGQYNMSIRTVEGNRVRGRVERSNVAAGITPDFNFIGTVTGNVLKFQGGPTTTELTIDGDQMRGQMYGTARMDISLSKRK